MRTEIWIANWIFEDNQGVVFTAKDVVTKRIPVKFVILEGLSYRRALNSLLLFSSSITNFISRLKDDKSTGLKKFKIIYTKKVGEVNESEMDRVFE